MNVPLDRGVVRLYEYLLDWITLVFPLRLPFPSNQFHKIKGFVIGAYRYPHLENSISVG